MGPIHPVQALAGIHPRWGNRYLNSSGEIWYPLKLIMFTPSGRPTSLSFEVSCRSEFLCLSERTPFYSPPSLDVAVVRQKEGEARALPPIAVPNVYRLL